MLCTLLFSINIYLNYFKLIGRNKITCESFYIMQCNLTFFKFRTHDQTAGFDVNIKLMKMENEYSSQQCHNFVYFCTRWRRECKHFAQNRIFITVVLSGTRCAVTELSRVHYSEGMSTIVRSQILTTLLYHLLVPQIKGASHGFNCIKMEVLFYRHFTLPD